MSKYNQRYNNNSSTDATTKRAIGAAKENMNEIIVMIDSTYARYKECPKWHTLQALFRLVFRLGIEQGRKEIFESQLMTLHDRQPAQNKKELAMSSKVKEFILKQKILSKCSAEEQQDILRELDRLQFLDLSYKALKEENDRLKVEREGFIDSLLY